MTEIIFHNYIQAQMGKPFIWGENDCNTFILKMMDHFQGTDYAADVVGKYSTKRGALKFAKKIGTLRDYLPLRKIKDNHAQTGDLILVKDQVFDRAHICTGSKVVSVIEDSVTTQIPMVKGDVYRWDLWAQ